MVIHNNSIRKYNSLLVNNNNSSLDVYKDQYSYNTKYNFCTVTGKEYLFKALALYWSLNKNSDKFHLWICCIDDVTYSTITSLNLNHLTAFKVSDIEDKQLLSIKTKRKTNEYCWTLKAALIQYVLNHYNVNALIYCDSDMFFFSDPEPIFNEWVGYSILLCPQRDLEWVHDVYGYYQAGLIGFKKDKQGLDALSWWKERCIEWCFAEPQRDRERFGDQKYLDKLPILFESIKIMKNLGVDAAPWNTIYNNNFNIYEKNNDIFIEKDKLIAYHFACVTIFNHEEFDLWTLDHLSINSIIKTKIYLPYIEIIRNIIKSTEKRVKKDFKQFFTDKDVSEAKTYFKYNQFNITSSQYDQYYFLCTVVSKDYLIKALTLYYSLKKVSNFHIWICCVDNIAFRTLSELDLKNATIIHVEEIEDDELLDAKKNRNITEYCWTLKAPLTLYLLKKYGLESLIYCDSDIYFFSNPKEILKEWQGYSFFMCRQRDDYEFEKIHGGFQAGLLGFRNDKRALDILNWWKKRCIEWCYNTPEPERERWGDQKYLDKVPLLFTGIKIVNHLGINAAPWNIVINNNYKVTKKNNDVFIDDYKLIVYHFGSMKIFNKIEYDLWKINPITFNDTIINLIYIPYINDLKKSINRIQELMPLNLRIFFDNDTVKNAQNYLKY